MTTELHRLSGKYEEAEAAFLASVRDGASRPALAERAQAVADAARAFNTEAYRKLHASEEDAWMPLDNLTDVTEVLNDLWSDLAAAYGR